MSRKLLVASVFLPAICWSSNLLADESISIERTIPISDSSQVKIDIAVGELKLEHYAGKDVQLYIEVERGSNWFSSVDLDDAKLTQQQNQKQLKLSVDLDNTKQQWTVKVPEGIPLDLNVGVGSARLYKIDDNLELDLGVGSADIELANSNYSRIRLDTGVGDARLRDFDNADTERALTSAEVNWTGNGEHLVDIDVGVGDVEVSLE